MPDSTRTATSPPTTAIWTTSPVRPPTSSAEPLRRSTASCGPGGVPAPDARPGPSPYGVGSTPSEGTTMTEAQDRPAMLTELDGDVWRITFDRPETGNALTPQLAADLAAALADR